VIRDRRQLGSGTGGAGVGFGLGEKFHRFGAVTKIGFSVEPGALTVIGLFAE
jgi:hypothetical protein